MGAREADIARIYASQSWSETEALLDFYNVRYVYLSNLERSTYPVSQGKFEQFLTVVYRQGEVVVYEVP